MVVVTVPRLGLRATRRVSAAGLRIRTQPGSPCRGQQVRRQSWPSNHDHGHTTSGPRPGPTVVDPAGQQPGKRPKSWPGARPAAAAAAAAAGCPLPARCWLSLGQLDSLDSVLRCFSLIFQRARLGLCTTRPGPLRPDPGSARRLNGPLRHHTMGKRDSGARRRNIEPELCR